MNKRNEQISADMYDLQTAGYSLRQIGEMYGMTNQGVWGRIKTFCKRNGYVGGLSIEPVDQAFYDDLQPDETISKLLSSKWL